MYHILLAIHTYTRNTTYSHYTSPIGYWQKPTFQHKSPQTQKITHDMSWTVSVSASTPASAQLKNIIFHRCSTQGTTVADAREVDPKGQSASTASTDEKHQQRNTSFIVMSIRCGLPSWASTKQKKKSCLQAEKEKMEDQEMISSYSLPVRCITPF